MFYFCAFLCVTEFYLGKSLRPWFELVHLEFAYPLDRCSGGLCRPRTNFVTKFLSKDSVDNTSSVDAYSNSDKNKLGVTDS